MRRLLQVGGWLPEGVAAKYGPLAGQLAELLAVAAVVYVVGRLVVVPLVSMALARTRMNVTVRRALGKVTRLAVVVAALDAGAAAAGFERVLVGSALLVAIVTLAVGLAAQDILSNVISGVFIVQDPKLNVGDHIVWGDQAGTISDIGFRVTRVRTADNDTVVVPNAELTNNAITNETVNDPIGIPYEFGVGYGDDVATVSDVIRRVADENEQVLDEPEPTVRVVELADNAVVLRSRVWVAKADRDRRAQVRSEFVRGVHEALRETGVDLSTTTQHALSGELGVREA